MKTDKVNCLKLFLIGFLILSGCQMKLTRPTKSTQATEKPKNESVQSQENIKTDVLPTEINTVQSSAQLNNLSKSKNEKIGLILSGGGARSWAYVNFFKEIQKYKLMITAIGGIEWGAVMAGIYAQNGSANEVEWEISKLKSLADKSEFLKKVFEKKSTQNLKIPFACTSTNLKNQTSYILSKGQLDTMIPYCLSAVGLAEPYADSIASLTDLAGLSQFLKNSGVTKIILVNLLGARNGKFFSNSLTSVENQYWIQAGANLNNSNYRKISGIDDIIEIDLDNINIDKFDDRKNILNNSIPNAKDQIKKIAEKYGY